MLVSQPAPNGDPRRMGPQYPRPADEDGGIYAERETHRNGSSGPGWLWVLPLAALAGLSWYLLRDTPADRGDVTASRETVQPAGVTTAAAGPELQKRTISTIQSVTSALRGVDNRASATAALPRIQAAAKNMERLAIQSAALPADGRTALAEATHDDMGKLNTLMDRVVDLPGVAPVLQPTIAALRGRMDAIAMVPGKPLFLASAPKEWMAMSGFYNRDVLNRAGDRVGTAAGFFIAPDGKIAALLVSVDRELGIGDKQVAMPFASGQLTRKNDGWHLVVDASKDELQRAKSFETGN
jgi:hypothetical protein